MPTKASPPEIDGLFGDPSSPGRAVYDALLGALHGLGRVDVEPKR